MFYYLKPIYILSLASLFLLSGCFGPKYIPKSYFNYKHNMKIKVKPFPAPSHIESGGTSDSGLVSGLVGAAVKRQIWKRRTRCPRVPVWEDDLPSLIWPSARTICGASTPGFDPLFAPPSCLLSAPMSWSTHSELWMPTRNRKHGCPRSSRPAGHWVV